ncbi:MAG: hypothetical protein CMJ64_26040 [Planctomycetaceae bacterium]|nr:hypothetical protein [Planctomycetaceae bacterium]
MEKTTTGSLPASRERDATIANVTASTTARHAAIPNHDCALACGFVLVGRGAGLWLATLPRLWSIPQTIGERSPR